VAAPDHKIRQCIHRTSSFPVPGGEIMGPKVAGSAFALNAGAPSLRMGAIAPSH